ncbi:MAG: hypothetical protein E7A54_05310 [Morganella morganii]|nr:hypothetical protein [Morganella morganii]MDU1072806.1 hypothetical protein [Morganella morganii]
MENNKEKIFNNIKDLSNTLDVVTEERFLSLLENQLADYKNKFLGKELYKGISKVVKLVNSKRVIEVCNLSINGEDTIHGDDFDFIIWSYISFVKILIEYKYYIPESKESVDIILEIEKFNRFNELFNDFYNEKYYIYYLSVKNYFIHRVISNDISILKSNKNSNIENKVLELDSLYDNLSEKVYALYSEEESFIERFKEKLDTESKILESEIFEKINDVKALESSVRNMSDNLTFIGLENAYGDLKEIKTKEKSSAFSFLLISIVCVFLPIMTKGLFYLFDVKYNLYGYTLTATTTLIFIYFFRVALLHYNSIKTELTQINLRRNLCMFINGYIDFSKRNENHQSLSKFENLIFSNIIPDDKNVPSSLDGIEQLANLINALKR